MLKFEKELQKFKPVLNVDDIEEHIASEDMRDVFDLISDYIGKESNLEIKKNYSVHKEL